MASIRVEVMRGQTVAIDTYSWLHKGIPIIRFGSSAPLFMDPISGTRTRVGGRRRGHFGERGRKGVGVTWKTGRCRTAALAALTRRWPGRPDSTGAMTRKRDGSLGEEIRRARWLGGWVRSAWCVRWPRESTTASGVRSAWTTAGRRRRPVVV
ncbi:hypothetical protein GUJ93_ZPchr0015g6727 [Zizania palustris]|uniref:Uncharacterized protein n=1 Tax=Zizania palustris TaxID=103762 RepID=A0A8J5VVE1_ZIZPA|nr:hypothetical protein GUJ93_ZPchr0015g6727 [Zizania palustris]